VIHPRDCPRNARQLTRGFRTAKRLRSARNPSACGITRERTSDRYRGIDGGRKRTLRSQCPLGAAVFTGFTGATIYAGIQISRGPFRDRTPASAANTSVSRSCGSLQNPNFTVRRALRALYHSLRSRALARTRKPDQLCGNPRLIVIAVLVNPLPRFPIAACRATLICKLPSLP
jgi:hypothetical protein